jgi:hypothetical protein
MEEARIVTSGRKVTARSLVWDEGSKEFQVAQAVFVLCMHPRQHMQKCVAQYCLPPTEHRGHIAVPAASGQAFYQHHQRPVGRHYAVGPRAPHPQAQGVIVGVLGSETQGLQHPKEVLPSELKVALELIFGKRRCRTLLFSWARR